MNRFSSTEHNTPVGEGNGEERDTEQSAALSSDPAPAELDDYRKRLIAYEAGKQAKADGMTATEVLCWQAGYYGEAMPESWEE